MRIKEMSFRVLNASLLFLHRMLLRTYGVGTAYTTQKAQISVSFEGSQFHYAIRRFGATGNLDFTETDETATRSALIARLRPEDVFYDIGAHGGVFTVTTQHQVRGLRVISFEPQPKELLLNLELNDMSTEQVYAVAVGEQADRVRMTSGKRSSNHLSASGDVEVDCVRLDDFRREKGLPAPSWVKIDIEGMELPALKGFAETLSVSKPVVICEINHVFDRFGTRLQDLIGFFAGMGYEVLAQHTSGFQHAQTEATTLEALGHSADDNFWFVPNEKLPLFITT
ncbi:FkbM family methyltransferase [Cognatiyoonia sp. IB215446]|uniref:FkbM family methyltransferase n=1 Tax=Cognatiyoonia sp. IB215446 TaxID=3097355 RepID=UPI002A0E73E2|nr:FkbM family methyltransferase [Cognatiyoonia sp. IB215446]MDX8347714.1 FkbM family methyltransferase [Cognatiyoonia sp. IB215446]